VAKAAVWWAGLQVQQQQQQQTCKALGLWSAVEVASH
jgi:hypothetical protein